MKKLSIRTLFVILIAVASISSYIYLGSLDYAGATAQPNAAVESVSEKSQEADTKLPDLRLLLKVIEVGQKWLPAS